MTTATVHINGEISQIPTGLTLAALLERLNVPAAGVAIAKNETVVPRSAFATEPVAGGDRIEIIRAVAGG